MTGTIGTIFLWMALAAACVAMGACCRGSRGGRLARAGTLGMSLSLLGTVGSLLVALLSDELSIAYVRAHSAVTQATQYKVAAIWAGQEGSLLLWAALCACAGTFLALRRTEDVGHRLAVAMGVGIVGSLIIILLAKANPFQLSQQTFAGEGHGLDPLLRHWAMVVHPPLVLAGYAASIVPAGIIVARLWSGRNDFEDGALRRWAVLAWLLLGVGIVLGARWAYVELGWGGYWNWDPVENASLLPWLFCTGLVHSMRLPAGGQRDRWVAVFGIGALLASLCGAWVTRSGAIASVHAFAVSDIGVWLALILAATAAVCMAAVIRGRRMAAIAKDGAFALRARSIVWGNVLIAWIALAVLIGLVTPLVCGLFGRSDVGVTSTFYLRLVIPPAIACLVLMGIAPFLPRGLGHAVDTERWTSKRVGVLAAHAGVIMLGAGVATSSLFAERNAGTLAKGESLQVGAYRCTLVDASQSTSEEGTTVEAAIRIEMLEASYILRPHQFFDATDARPTTEVAIRSFWTRDVYVALVGWEPGGTRVAIEVRVLPFVSLIWVGAGLAAIATGTLAFLPAILHVRRFANATRKRGVQEDTTPDTRALAGVQTGVSR